VPRFSHMDFNPEPVKMRKYKEVINSIFILSKYEEAVLSAVLASREPVCVHDLIQICGVPRTKVYGTLKSLKKMGLVNIIILTEDEVVKPDIWEFWPEHKQKQYLSEKLVNVTRYVAEKEAIESRIVEFTRCAQETSRLWGELRGASS